MPKAGATVRQTEEGESVGPRMHAALRLLSKRAYTSMNDLATSVGPNGSQDYGYRIVHRLKHKRLIRLDPYHPDATPQGRGAVILSQKGARYINAHTDKELDPDDYPPEEWRHRDGDWRDDDE